MKKTKQKKNKKIRSRGKKGKLKLVALLIVAILVLFGTIVSFIIFRNIANDEDDNDKNDTVRASLESCLEKTKHISIKVDHYNAIIECYKNNEVEESAERIALFESSVRTENLNACVYKAQKDYLVTDEERVAASYGTTATILGVMDRIIKGFEAEISCYKTYEVSNSSTKISELEIKKREAENAVAEITSYSNTYTQPSNSSSAPSVQSGDASTQKTPLNASNDGSGSVETKSCDSYYSSYYVQYEANIASIVARYNSQISDASMSCSSFGGCPRVTELTRQRDAALQQEKLDFQQKLISVGCGSYYDL